MRACIDADSADDSSGSTEGCDDVDEMDDDEDDVTGFVADRGMAGCQHQQPEQTGSDDSEIIRLANEIVRDYPK